MQLIFIAAIFLCPLMASADEAQLPDFQHPPQLYTHTHIIAVNNVGAENGTSPARVSDEILLGDRTKTAVKFHLRTLESNYHTCTLAGSAAAIAPNTFEYRENDCVLKISYMNSTVKLADIGGFCSRFPGNCGRGALIGNITLNRAPLRQSTYWRPKK